ncbi:aminoglycoside phosphotransferase family protein [Microlunatus sp. GCM10028923]|uniref:aminoglycoside phosphotransferase family protein n=1 Tax=Microlunatus sp. GCM10028923 TaxID=3273400 RepID=UPI00360D8FC4
MINWDLPLSRTGSMAESDRQRILRHHPHTGPGWLDRLPGLIDRYRRQWRLVLRLRSFTGGAASWAAPVELADGGRAVLKLGLPSHESIDLAAAWRAYDPRGLVRLLAHDAADNASLIELCEPGDAAVDLPAAASDDAATEVLPRLWAPAPDLELPLLSEIAARQAARLRDRADRLGASLYRDGSELFDELAATTPAELILHGDFHPRNVLRSVRGWLAIDPRPMIGEPGYDLANHLLYQIQDDPDPVGRAARLAERVGVSPRRTHLWLAAKLVQFVSWLHHTGQADWADARRPTALRLLGAL